jgi:hypothetical protein
MKPNLLFQKVILFLFVTQTINIYSQISLKFTAENFCKHVKLDSILIKNVSTNTDTILNYPDTVLNLNVLSMLELKDDNVFVSNYPNPFYNETYIKLNISEYSQTNIKIYTLEGKLLIDKSFGLSKGYHSIKYNNEKPGIYIAQIQINDTKKVLKLIGMGSNIQQDISLRYFGFESFEYKNIESSFVYSLGDILKYSGYITNQSIIESVDIEDTPLTDKMYKFVFNNDLPQSIVSGVHSASENSITWNWNSVVGAVGYKINTVNTFSTATDIGNNTNFVQTGLNCDTEYNLYVWSYNTCGNSQPLLLNQKTSDCPFFCEIGQFGPAGGIIFYCDPTNTWGLESALNDQSTNVQWGCYETLIGGTLPTLGSGYNNTMLIVNNCSATNIAARKCTELTFGDKQDWFLPSIVELNFLWAQRFFVGNFGTVQYWSSSEQDSNKAYTKSFASHGAESAIDKNFGFRVRCIRKIE